MAISDLNLGAALGSGVAIDRRRHLAWFASSAGQLRGVDLLTDRILPATDTVGSGGSGPSGIAPGPQGIAVDEPSGVVFMVGQEGFVAVTPDTRHVRSLALRASVVVLDEGLRRVYVLGHGPDVTILDTDRLVEVARFSTGARGDVAGADSSAGVDVSRHRLVLWQRGLAAVKVFDGTDGRLVRELPFFSPHRVTVDGRRNRIMVTCVDETSAAFIANVDATTFADLGRRPVGSWPDSTLVCPATGVVFSASHGSGLVGFNPADGSDVARVSIPWRGAAGPRGIAHDPIADAFAVAHFHGPAIIVRGAEPSEINRRHAAGAAPRLGQPLGEEQITRSGNARVRRYQNGNLYWTPEDGAFSVDGSLRDRYEILGEDQSPLGLPLSDTGSTQDGGGRQSVFAGGMVVARSDQDPGRALWGPVYRKWLDLGGIASVVGYPISDVSACPDGAGVYAHFEGGSIYAHPRTGAFEVHGEVRVAWQASGWERGPLGYPRSDDTATPVGTPGRMGMFVHGMAVALNGQKGVVTYGAIFERWRQLGGFGFLGAPTTSEEPGRGNQQGRVSRFQRGGIWWTPTTGAHEVYGAIHGFYEAHGGEKSSLGYPTTGELPHPQGDGARYNDFQGGFIVWSPQRGAHIEDHG